MLSLPTYLPFKSGRQGGGKLLKLLPDIRDYAVISLSLLAIKEVTLEVSKSGETLSAKVAQETGEDRVAQSKKMKS